MALKLPRLVAAASIANLPDGSQAPPSPTIIQWWNSLATQIETNENSIATTQAQIESILGIANTAATTAKTNAQAVSALAVQASGLLASVLINNSYVTGMTIQATDAGASATITIGNHTRVYGDGSSVAVTGGTVPTLAYSTSYYVFYDQSSRAGGAVSYQAATTIATAGNSATNPFRTFVGAVVTPAALGTPIKGIGALPPSVDLPGGFVYA